MHLESWANRKRRGGVGRFALRNERKTINSTASSGPAKIRRTGQPRANRLAGRSGLVPDFPVREWCNRDHPPDPRAEAGADPVRFRILPKGGCQSSITGTSSLFLSGSQDSDAESFAYNIELFGEEVRVHSKTSTIFCRAADQDRQNCLGGAGFQPAVWQEAGKMPAPPTTHPRSCDPPPRLIG